MIWSNKAFRITKVSALAVLLSFAGALAVSSQQGPHVATGKLKGVLEDWQYARILRSCLTVRNKTFQRKILTDELGEFEAELPAGTYEVVFLAPSFRPLRRKNVQIEPGTTTALNALLDVAPEVSGQCPAGTLRRGNLCDSLCDIDAIPKRLK
jgi:hypothetical protein